MLLPSQTRPSTSAQITSGHILGFAHITHTHTHTHTCKHHITRMHTSHLHITHAHATHMYAHTTHTYAHTHTLHVMPSPPPHTHTGRWYSRDHSGCSSLPPRHNQDTPPEQQGILGDRRLPQNLCRNRACSSRLRPHRYAPPPQAGSGSTGMLHPRYILATQVTLPIPALIPF